ncbi:hypothetical protein [Fulvivirga sedimenti]|uniref:Tetratricopeptide repeat protein n=1 Tax=Fulvivirga sedimenti TaxID=2879465 RepID=A0A9X1L0R5_9BACT|nr:hypothetical protein [Fulvivirga sedimenti]MCA6074964.1 hypothetical protein [Fulvivirga sedimenti]MCA6076141.1 hypothetical protein [Fulvivirga sedimenti]MCA6077269.1 hypothetical protein [Fulvivirga sedimenti]
MYRLILFIGVLLTSFTLSAQTEQEKIREDIAQRQAQYQTALDRLIENGVEKMDAGDFEGANVIFKDVLKNAQVVPTEMTFYFGKNSFYLEKYEQSIDWLNKYIQLKGTQGRYFEEATDLLNKSNAAVRLMRQQEAKATEAILAADYDIDCGPTGMVICPVCQGRGVIITKTSFGQNYRECPYSDEHGLLTCEEYNLLLKGKLEKKINN